jgi:dTDP-4-dehydrorhamnose 3,5-epimerase-like enzyme
MKIEITKIDVKAVDDRGALHYFSTDRTGEFLLVYRNKGSISGQHYHKGASANKHPEDMLLVQGAIRLLWKELVINENAAHTIEGLESGEMEVVAPARVKIPAGIWHQVTAITDIVFIELNSLADGSEDTYRL